MNRTGLQVLLWIIMDYYGAADSIVWSLSFRIRRIASEHDRSKQLESYIISRVLQTRPSSPFSPTLLIYNHYELSNTPNTLPAHGRVSSTRDFAPDNPRYRPLLALSTISQHTRPNCPRGRPIRHELLLLQPLCIESRLCPLKSFSEKL